MKNLFTIFFLLLAVTARAQSWQNMTFAALPTTTTISKAFSIAAPDVNIDGCIDIFVSNHADPGASAMYSQDKTPGGACAGTFTPVPASLANFSQATPTTINISSRHQFLNIYNDPQGFPSIYGFELGGLLQSAYPASAGLTPGATPHYDTKRVGCPGTKTQCIPSPVVSGDTLQWIAFGKASSPARIASVLDINTGNTLLLPPTEFPAHSKTNLVAVMDVDPFGLNSQPEIIDLNAGGYWRYEDAALVWHGGTVPKVTNAQHTNHLTYLDYDADGDTDLFYTWMLSSTAPDATPYLLRNDGNGTFSVDDHDFPRMISQAYWSAYGNTSSADLDLDRYPDLIYCAGGYSSVQVLKNNAGLYSQASNITQAYDSSNTNKPYCGVADLDSDGLVDIVKTAPQPQMLSLWKNLNADGNHWIRFRARGLGANSDGVGAQIRIIDPATNQIITSAQVLPGQLIPHLGVGSATSVTVEFIFAHQSTPGIAYNIATDSDYVIYQDSGLVTLYTPGTAITR